jgi:hypothetical protein
MGDARAFVAEAEVALSADGDLAAVGAAVTVELCGHCSFVADPATPVRLPLRRSDSPEEKSVAAFLRDAGGFRVVL